MPAARVCSECGAPLTGLAPSAKTCSVRCRQKRGRRRKKANDEIAQQAELGVHEVVKREGPTAIERIMKQELVPVVREAIDEDVIKAIQRLVAITPAAIAQIATDLESEDPVMRSRAAALVVKYTIGHPALVKPSDQKHEQLIVNFSLPRPEDAPVEETVEVEEVEETRVCDICGREKVASEFVAGSERCQSCFDEAKAKILAEFQ